MERHRSPNHILNISQHSVRKLRTNKYTSFRLAKRTDCLGRYLHRANYVHCAVRTLLIDWFFYILNWGKIIEHTRRLKKIGMHCLSQLIFQNFSSTIIHESWRLVLLCMHKRCRNNWTVCFVHFHHWTHRIISIARSPEILVGSWHPSQKRASTNGPWRLFENFSWRRFCLKLSSFSTWPIIEILVRPGLFSL